MEKRLFTEFFNIGTSAARLINDAKHDGVPVIPVGTTALRTLESAAAQDSVRAGEGKTEIFIFPPFKFRITDALITNFHVPRSSLMLLVDAFLEHKHAKRRILDLYTIAIRKKFRFYSFGDGMLIK
jgi:S-adenosylmethionine:tRNA ribosyltransferase-isomerase